MSNIFGRTLRQPPSGFDPSTSYALRAALVRLPQDRTILLPLGLRVVDRIVKALMEEKGDSHSIEMSGEASSDAWMSLIEGEVQSYRQLPLQLTTRRWEYFTSEPKGLARPAWVQGLHWCCATATEEAHRAQRDRWLAWGEAGLRSMGLHPQGVEWSRDVVGWVQKNDYGPEGLLECPSCGYMARQDIARFERSPQVQEEISALETVSTPDANTIESLAACLDIPLAKTLKAVFLTADDGGLVFVVLRGDLEISLAKLTRVVGGRTLVPAPESRIRGIGAVPGYASPIGLEVRADAESEGIFVVGDTSIERGMNFAAGANKQGFHFTGVNYPRDFRVSLVADIAMPREGDACPACGAKLIGHSGIFLGGWEDFGGGFHFTEEGGQEGEGFAGEGILYLEPILAALIDVHHQDGIANWPAKLAPFDVYLVDLRCPHESSQALAALREKGLRVLLDDRSVSPGVKFTDADLIGCFLRVTVSKRSLDKGGVEVFCRHAQEERIIPLDSLGTEVFQLRSKLM